MFTITVYYALPLFMVYLFLYSWSSGQISEGIGTVVKTLVIGTQRGHCVASQTQKNNREKISSSFGWRTTHGIGSLFTSAQGGTFLSACRK